MVSLILMVSDYQFKTMGAARSIASYLLTPFETIMLAPRDMLLASYDYLTTKGSLEQENEALTKRVAELILLANQSELFMSENAQLRKLIGIQEQSRFKILISQIQIGRAHV